MAKNILFFIPRIRREHGGIFQYSIRVLDAMLNTNHFIYVYNSSVSEYIKNEFKNRNNLILVPEINSSRTFLSRGIAKAQRISSCLNKEISIFRNYETDQNVKKICKHYSIDFVHSPTQGYPLLKNTPFIFTLHDVQELHFPEYFTPIIRESRARNNRIGCEKAKRIIVSYNHVKDDLVRYFQVDAERIEVVFIGTSDNSLVPRITSSDVKSDYILYPAATWPHKNHSNLLFAFAKARAQNERMREIRLIFTGNKTEHYPQLISLIKKLNIEDWVEFKGVVSDTHLKTLYNNCRAVVVPTKYEAGSFPLMESIAQTIPVICSNVTSLPETIKNEKFIFDPDSISEISEKIIKICLDPKFRQENILNSRIQRKFIMNQDITFDLNKIYDKLT